MNLTSGYTQIVMSMSLSYAYSLCVKNYGATIVGGQSRIQEILKKPSLLLEVIIK